MRKAAKTIDLELGFCSGHSKNNNGQKKPL